MATSSDNKQQGSKSTSSSGSGSGGNKQSDTSKRGFASMDPAQQREIASEGGRAAHEKGTAHEFTSEEARRAGSQSHKNDASRQSASSSSGSRDNAGMNQEGNRDSGNKQSGGSGSGTGSSGSRNK
ncbi:KGG domain-containing protein [Janthinobacterium sp. 64]|uniref:KGG domain-containing protein n=1 Tax=Janthinobacterium sp. 64 TaxID=2035208 RepID=UPI000C2CCBC6|nr:KGG domain-containing protein [Janthinobacterium sp. 64]PKB21573.1 stress-induced acidophilic repeat protein [Janthinobacterium sp. 64]